MTTGHQNDPCLLFLLEVCRPKNPGIKGETIFPFSPGDPTIEET